MSFQVGKYYRVQCVQLAPHCYFRGQGPGTWLPVIGKKHDDKEILGFPLQHWHIDWRFAGEALWKRASAESDRHFFGVVISSPDCAGNTFVSSEGIRKKRMLRLVAAFPNIHSSDNEWGRLQAAYAGAVAKCNTCPHRGISLDGAPVEHGARVCPGHGLAFDLVTGKQVNRRL